jgi:2-oxoglutarate ferredoxin oxidoreductase subunit beta
MASIGTGEIMHACNSGDDFVVIFINNGILWHDRRTNGASHLLGQVTPLPHADAMLP